MSVNSLSLQAPFSLLGDTSRRDEVQRLAQSVGAAQLGGGNAFQNGNGSAGLVDIARISSEALEEVAGSGNAEGIQRTDQLVSALMEAFGSRTSDRDQTQAAQGADQVENEAPEAPEKKKVKTRTSVWEPTVQANQILPEGREVIGKITVKEDVREVDAPASGGKGGGAKHGGGAATGSSSNFSASAPRRASNGNSSVKPPKKSEKKPVDPEDDAKNETEGAAMAQNLKSAGLQAAGVEKGAENNEVGEKSKEFDVRTPATGASQMITVREAGELGKGSQKLGTFKRLEDKPVLKYATLHARGDSLDRVADNYAKEAARVGERPDQVEETHKKLKSDAADG